jgi:hypothetical protein
LYQGFYKKFIKNIKNMKKIVLFLGVVVVQSSFAQVGISTESPKATLDVVAKPNDITKTDGFIAPRLTGNELKAKDLLYGTDQLGAIIYATAAASPVTPKTINVTQVGYYYFDGSLWIKITDGNSGTIEPWNVSGTNTPAALNTQDIYQMGKIGINSKTPSAALHILNDNKTTADDNIIIDSYNTTPGSEFFFRGARGTEALPQNLQNDDNIGAFHFRPYFNGAFQNTSSIVARYKGDGTTNLSNMFFNASGSTRMFIQEYGHVGINTTAPEKQLEVVGDFRASKADTPSSTQFLLETNSNLLSGFNVYGVTDTTSGTGSFFAQNKSNTIISQSSPTGSSGSLNIQNVGNTTFLNFYSSDSDGRSNNISTVPGGSTSFSTTDNTNPAYGTSAFATHPALGVYFQFKDTNDVNKGFYYFPKTDGKRGQVLVTHGKSSDPGNGNMNNNLTWRDVADLILLKAPNGTCYKLTVSNLGVLGTVADTDCTVDAYNPGAFARTAGASVQDPDALTAEKVSIMLEKQDKIIKDLEKKVKDLQAHKSKP